MIQTWAGNLLWMAGCAKARRAYRRGLADPRAVQTRILLDFLKKNAGTEYGIRHGYAGIRTIAEFQDSVPIVTYNDLEPWIERIRRGCPGVLTTEPVLMMEKTSGSSGGVKYVTYTASLRRQFQRALGAWIYDLFSNRPALLGGAHYWQISPVAREKEVTPGGIPVGFEDDCEYLTSVERRAAEWVMAVPSSVSRIPDVEEWSRSTLRHLMARRDLRFISVWNPSFLSILMSRLPRGLHPRDLWPKLALISCWASGPSSRFLPELREYFPGVEIQGKGLLATEGIVTFPEFGRLAPSPAITSHFLEFQAENGRVYLADELEVGKRYTVLLTTGGGFARYALGDRVEVVAPGALEFLGRSGGVSDLCGEKLSEPFTALILDEAASRFDLRGLTLLAPEWGSPPRYNLFVESEAAGAVGEFVEKRLRKSVHYDYCRKLGQLGALEAVRVSEGGERYLRGCQALGQGVGNVKPASLRSEFGWRERLEHRHAG